MSYSLESGCSLRTFNVLDDFNREGLWIEINTSLPATRVTRVLDMIASERGYPEQLRVDNGSELISHHMAEWVRRHAVHIQFIQPS